MTPDFWPDLWVFAELIAGPLLVLGAITARAVWRERHPNHDKETDQ